MTTDHRKGPRRRGSELETAILDTVVAELGEVGYAGLTIERVAERSGTGKASIYRRWPGRPELVMAALYHALPQPLAGLDTGSMRGDVLALLRLMASLLNGPAGEAVRGLLGESLQGEGVAMLRRLSQGMGRQAMREIADRAVARGEIRASAVTSLRLRVLQYMLRSYYLFEGPPISDRVLVQIADEVVLPVFASPPP